MCGCACWPTCERRRRPGRTRVADGPEHGPAANAPTPAVEPQDMEPSPALRIVGKYPPSLKGRAVGILVTDGADGDRRRRRPQGRRGRGRERQDRRTEDRRRDAEGRQACCTADGQLAGTPSVVFDAVALVLSEAGCAELLNESAAIDFAKDAFGHLKAIGFTAEAQPLAGQGGRDAGRGRGRPERRGGEVHRARENAPMGSRAESAHARLRCAELSRRR